MSIAGEIRRIRANIASAYDVCEEMDAEMPPVRSSGNLADTIGSIPVDTARKVVYFYDYDGTRLYSYTKAEINALTQLPAPPTHTGLISDGWNWTLEEIRSAVNTCACRVNVGSFFRTENGTTRIYIRLEDGETDFHLRLYQSVSENTTIDWGDGSPTQTLDVRMSNYNNRSMYEATHTYFPSDYPADYVVTLRLTGGGVYGFGVRSHADVGIISRTGNAVRRIELSGAESLSSGAFMSQKKLAAIAWNGMCTEHDDLFRQCADLEFLTLRYIGNPEIAFGCRSLRCVSVSPDCAAIGQNAFFGCNSLESAGAFPNCALVGSSAFNGCCALTQIDLPRCAAIGSSAFEYCRALRRAYIPACVTVDYNAFHGCTCLSEVSDFQRCERIGNGAFYECYMLGKLLEAGYYDNNVYSDNYAVKRLVIPACTGYISLNSFCNMYAFEEVDLTAFTDPASLPTLEQGFKSVFTCADSNVGIRRDVVFYVADDTMKAAFSTAEKWSEGANYYIAVG